MKITCSALVLVGVLAIVELTGAQECLPGQTRNIDCNSCRCINYNWACTRKGCISKRDVKVECLPGQTKRVDCNTCTCANNLWGCTRMACPQISPPRPPVWQGECIEGSSKMEDCNACNCINGAWSCSKKHCISRRQTRCTPNTTYKKACNTCSCAADGHTEACTFKLCY